MNNFIKKITQLIILTITILFIIPNKTYAEKIYVNREENSKALDRVKILKAAFELKKELRKNKTIFGNRVNFITELLKNAPLVEIPQVEVPQLDVTPISNDYKYLKSLNHKDLEKELDDTKKEIKRIDYVLKGNKGDIISRGIAGPKNLDMVADIIIGDDILEGIKVGTTVRVASASGDAIGRIAEEYSKRLLGGIVRSLENNVNLITNFLFHNGKKPFTTAEIISWKKLISNELREIETMVRNAEKHSSRSREEILRELEDSTIESDEEILNLWRDFTEDLAYTCKELSHELSDRKNYYSKKAIGFGIPNCTDRLANKLLKFSTWLESVSSLKDFAALPEVKLIAIAMKKSIENYFDNLLDQIEPSKSAKNTSSTSSYSSKPKYDHNENLPSYLIN